MPARAWSGKMKKCKITVMRQTCYPDLMERYENPMEHACDMQVGQVFIANGWQRRQNNRKIRCSIYGKFSSKSRK